MTLGFGEIVRLLADNLDEITGGGRGLAQVAYPRFGVTDEYPARACSPPATSARP